MEYSQRYLLEGHTKPAVRANKRFSKDKSQKEEYNRYRLCLANYREQAWVQRTQQDTWLISAGMPMMVLLRFFVHKRSLFASDVDNMEKTVLDAMTGVAYEDDRYVVSLHSWEMVIPDNREPYVLVQIVCLA